MLVFLGLLLYCVVLRLLAWHSVVETTMVEPVCSGERSPPGTKHGTELTLWLFSCPATLSAQTRPCPLPLFTPSPSVSPPRKLQFLLSSPSLSLFLRLQCSVLPPQSLLSISSFLLPHKDIHSPVALKGETKCPLKMQSPAQKCHSSQDFGLEIRSHSPRPELLCVSCSLRGSLFSIATVWVRMEERRGAAGLVPSWKE